MKKILLMLALFLGHHSISQSLPDFGAVRLDQSSDYQAADSIALQTSTFLLSTPFEKNDLSRLKSLQFLIKWMSGTPDYTFSLDKVAGKISKGNDDMLGLYMACMTKYCLENKINAKDQKLVQLNSIKLLLAYCENSSNKITMTKGLRKLSEANQKGELEQAL